MNNDTTDYNAVCVEFLEKQIKKGRANCVSAIKNDRPKADVENIIKKVDIYTKILKIVGDKMDEHDATEQAYKNGYAEGYNDGYTDGQKAKSKANEKTDGEVAKSK